VEWVDVAMEEYKTLREESLSAIEQAQHSLQLGLAAIAAITAFGATKGTSGATVQDVAIAVASPLVAALVGVLWLLEVRRAVRAGAYNARLEQRINRHFPNEKAALGWESEIQRQFTGKGSYTFDRAVLLTLFATTIPSVVVGLVRLDKRHQEGWFWGALAFDIALLLAAIAYQLVGNRAMTRVREAAKKAIATGCT
jgi:hypothetical protein